jgi:hypothetical protein
MTMTMPIPILLLTSFKHTIIYRTSPHIPISALNPVNFHLFVTFKDILRGIDFASNQELKEACTQGLV